MLHLAITEGIERFGGIFEEQRLLLPPAVFERWNVRCRCSATRLSLPCAPQLEGLTTLTDRCTLLRLLRDVESLLVNTSIFYRLLIITFNDLSAFYGHCH